MAFRRRPFREEPGEADGAGGRGPPCQSHLSSHWRPSRPNGGGKELIAGRRGRSECGRIVANSWAGTTATESLTAGQPGALSCQSCRPNASAGRRRRWCGRRGNTAHAQVRNDDIELVITEGEILRVCFSKSGSRGSLPGGTNMAAPIVGETRIGIRLAWRRRAPSRAPLSGPKNRPRSDYGIESPQDGRADRRAKADAQAAARRADREANP